MHAKLALSRRRKAVRNNSRSRSKSVQMWSDLILTLAVHAKLVLSGRLKTKRQQQQQQQQQGVQL
jgi:hypothetical protein